MKKLLVALLVVALVITSVSTVYADDGICRKGATEEEIEACKDFLTRNGIPFWAPFVESTCSADSASSSVSGSGNVEKIWNWLTNKGMSDIGAAGIMGNMQVESGFNPFRIQGGAPLRTYNAMVGSSAYNSAFGLVQWDGTRRQDVLKYLDSKDSSYRQYVADEYGEGADSYTNAPAEVLDDFLGYELDFMYSEATPGGGRPTTWKNLLAAETPEEAANTFEEIFEGSVRTGGGPHVDAAKAIFAKYAGSGSSDSSGNTSCPTGSTVSEGGLTEEQALKFMMNYGLNKNGDSWTAATSGTGQPSPNCNGGPLSNCTSFSAFFANKFTDADFRGGNGENVVSNMSKGGVPTGSTPKLYAIFSWDGGAYGHTGVVLGIHGDTIIVGHASCSSPGTGKGNGTEAGGGAGFIRVGNKNDPSVWLGRIPTEFAYPKNVDTNKIEGYVNGVL